MRRRRHVRQAPDRPAGRDVGACAAAIVYINGKPLSEPYIKQARRGDGHAAAEARCRQGHYIFLGDNRTHSCDSRQWGSVPRGSLIGKVFAVYWPPNRIVRVSV